MEKKSETKETMAERLIRLRKAKGLKVSEVAKLIGVAPSTYREWEYGRAISGEPYMKLKEILGVSLEELISGQQSDLKGAIKEIESIEAHLQALKQILAANDRF